MLLLCALEEFPEAVEAALEIPPVSRDPRGLSIEPARTEPAAAYPSDFLGSHQAGGFEHSDVLLDSRQSDVEGVGKLADPGVRTAEAFENSSAGRVGERAKCRIEPGLILNHMVQYIMVLYSCQLHLSGSDLLIELPRMAKHRLELFSALLTLGAFSVACHKGTRGQTNPPDVRRETRDVARTKDTARDVVTVTDPTVVAFFSDTGVTNVFSREGQTFKLPEQRQALRATIRKERELWQGRKPPDYRFLLRVGCFCPGPRGWLLMDVRDGKPLRAWDKSGRSAALSDWNTYSIDGLYDNLEQMDFKGQIQVAFDPRWHFPRYVYTVVLPGPDAWSTVEVRGFRPN